MLTTEFDIDIAKKVWQEEAREDGREEGLSEARVEFLSLLESGKSVDEIKKLLNRENRPQCCKTGDGSQSY